MGANDGQIPSRFRESESGRKAGPGDTSSAGVNATRRDRLALLRGGALIPSILFKRSSRFTVGDRQGVGRVERLEAER